MIGELANKAFRVKLPSTAGVNAVTRTAISTSAVNIDMSAVVGNFVKMQAVGADAYFKMTSSSGDTTVTAATTDGGVMIAAGQFFEGWVNATYKYCKVIGSASGALFWWDSSEEDPG